MDAQLSSSRDPSPTLFRRESRPNARITKISERFDLSTTSHGPPEFKRPSKISKEPTDGSSIGNVRHFPTMNMGLVQSTDNQSDKLSMLLQKHKEDGRKST